MRFEKTMVFSLIALIAAACGRQGNTSHDSRVQTVAIAQTSVKDQQEVGFCWSYAMMATMESRYKIQTGKDVALSPEALGFYRMASGLYDLTRQKSAPDILSQALGDSLQGFDFKPVGYKNSGDALVLLKQYGVVPSSVWNYQFNKPGQAEALAITIKANLAKLVFQRILKGKDATDLTMDDIINKVMVGKDAFPSRPPLNFEFEGQSISSVAMMRDVMQFHPEDQQVLSATNEQELPALLSAIKRTLARGLDPVLGFPVVSPLNKGDAFTGKGLDLNDAKSFKRDGGHAVVITDFVNHGGQEGAVADDTLHSEMAKGLDELDYLLVKNSWGTDVKRNDQGQVIKGSETGYYKIDREYMLGVLRSGNDDSFDIVIPKDIAANPFGNN